MVFREYGRACKQEKTHFFSVEKARFTQLNMSKLIIQRNTLPEEVRYVAGVDVAYAKGFSIGAATVLDYTSLSLVESKTAHVKTRFAYVPTLLSFREIPPALAAAKKLFLQPDVFLVDGHGIAHPYRCGFASHLGLVLGLPTIGVAKKPLIKTNALRVNEGNLEPTIHKGEIVGMRLTTNPKTKPVYVSIGHLISLEKALEVVKHCTPKHRIPKPIRLAHNVAALEKRKVQNDELIKGR